MHISNDLKLYRENNGLSQKDLAKLMGVSSSTVARWESNKLPSNLGIQKLKELEILNQNQIKKMLTSEKNKSQLNNERDFLLPSGSKKATYAPYVVNGPEDQNIFHNHLINLQQNINLKIPEIEYIKRLSLISEVEGIETAQKKLEKSSEKSKSWNSNYGSHGWHRYIGRFPPHLVRSILNNFQATSDDIVLDPFSGSGTTVVECRMLGIPAIGIEISTLSALISRTKSKFTINPDDIMNMYVHLEIFYKEKWIDFVDEKDFSEISYEDIMGRINNPIKPFKNYEKWFSKEALLGSSIVMEFASSLEGYIQDILLVALSSKMRSIGNVDVDVVRAEYSKLPRVNVDVLKLIKMQLLKMANSIKGTLETHENVLVDVEKINIIEGDVLQTNLEDKSISYIITSPPYGVESISYLRTHLLSFKVLDSILKADPYQIGEDVIGSEFLSKENLTMREFKSTNLSETFKKYFSNVYDEKSSKKERTRVLMMMQFFDDMNELSIKFHKWLKDDGKIAFVIGNKKIGNEIIPTHQIIEEIFESNGLKLYDITRHKLKTNNSNSQVPWQERIIEEEYIMFFRKGE